MQFQTVTIVGVGLIGGSFGLALKKSGFDGRIVGVSSPASLEKALARGAIDEGASFENGVGAADLVYLAQPILRILDQLPAVARAVKPGAVVTDAGSTKEAISKKAAEVMPLEGLFVGGHPMAGKEGRGVEIAEADLFADAVYVLTPDQSHLDDPRMLALGDLVKRIGARPRIMAPGDHDRIVACTSHLPQIASSALAASVVDQLASEDEVEVSGGGLRDMTRLAESSFEMWEGIFSTNRNSILNAIDAYAAELARFRKALAEQTLEGRFGDAQKARRAIRGVTVFTETE